MKTAAAPVASEATLLTEARQALEMALAAGADDAVARLIEGRGTSYQLRDGRLETVKHSATRALSVSLYVDGRYSGHSSNDLRPEVLRVFLADAVALTRALEPDPHRRLPDPSRYAGRSQADLELVDPEVRAIGRDPSRAWLEKMDARAHADERVISSTSHLSLREGAMAGVSSNGFEGTNHSTSVSTYTDVTVQDEGDKRPEAYAYAATRHVADLPDVEGIAADALDRALKRLGSRKGGSERTVLVVDRESADGLLGRMFGALTGAAIQQGRSFLADHLDRPIASPVLTIVDDPLEVRGLGSHTFDGDGLATRPRTVIEDGVLRTFFIDSYYASKLGVEPTTGGPSNLIVRPGDKDLDALVADVSRGVYVTTWAGGNADPTNGDFSFGLQGHRIEDGKIGASLGEMNVSGTYLALLRNLVAVGNDPFPYSSFRTPTMVFEDVQISGS